MAPIVKNIFVVCNLPPDRTPPVKEDAFVSATQTDPETISVAYGGFRDPESKVGVCEAVVVPTLTCWRRAWPQVTGYTVCIGSTPGAQDIGACQFRELDKSALFNLLPLQGKDGTLAFVSVLARNGEGLESLVADRLEIDDSAPVVTSLEVHRSHDDVFVSDPLIKHSDVQALKLRISVEEPNREPNVVVKMVEVAVGLGPDSYQDAAEWTEVTQDFNTNKEPATVVISGLNMTHGVTYFVHARTTSSIGRQAITTAPTRVFVDLTPPVPVSPVGVHNGESIMLEYLLEWLELSARTPAHSATTWQVGPTWRMADNESALVQCCAQVQDAQGNPEQPIARRCFSGDVTSDMMRGLDLPHLLRLEVAVACQNEANLWGTATSATIAIDKTRPHTRQALDLRGIPHEGSSLAVQPEPGSDAAKGLFQPSLLTPGEVSAVDLDFVVELTTLRVAFAVWDEDSGVQLVMVAVGDAPGSTSVSPWTVVDTGGKRYVEVDLPEGATLQRHKRYFVAVSAVNVSATRAS